MKELLGPFYLINGADWIIKHSERKRIPDDK